MIDPAPSARDRRPHAPPTLENTERFPNLTAGKGRTNDVFGVPNVGRTF